MLDCEFISIKHKGSFAKVARLTSIGSVDLGSDLIGTVRSGSDGCEWLWWVWAAELAAGGGAARRGAAAGSPALAELGHRGTNSSRVWPGR